MKKSSRAILVLVIAGLFLVFLKFFSGNSSPTTSDDSNAAVATKADDLKSAGSPTQAKSPVTTASAVSSNDPKVQAQLQVLTEILKSKNDNDPRMDSELKILSTEAKEKIRDLYKSLPMENRNDRGTIVFLLGRNISDDHDLGFFKEVLNEAPCKSIQDCNKDEVATADREHEEHAGGMAVSLAYPQMVALHSLKSFAEKNADRPLTEKVKDLIAQAKHSQVPEVAKMAQGLE